MICQEIPGQERPDPICCLQKQSIRGGKSTACSENETIWDSQQRQWLYAQFMPCPGSCSPQMRQGKAESGSHIFLTRGPSPALLGEEGGKARAYVGVREKGEYMVCVYMYEENGEVYMYTEQGYTDLSPNTNECKGVSWGQ